jgi:hypothetical protein
MRYTKKNDFRRNSKFHMENVIAFLFILFAAPAWCVADIQQDKDGNSVEFAYATMSDGVKIAVAVGYPKGFDPQDQAQKWPAIRRACCCPCCPACRRFPRILLMLATTWGSIC